MSEACKCIGEIDSDLRSKGFRFPDSMSRLFIRGTMICCQWVLPVVTKDGKRTKRADPNCVKMVYCPFCGDRLEPEDSSAIAKAEGRAG